MNTRKTERSRTHPLFCALILIANEASAQAAAAPAPDGMKSILVNLPPILALFALFYFGMIRPQRNTQKKHLEFVQKLSRGDEVVTQSGIIGKVAGLTEKVVTLEVSPGTEIKFLRTQIQSSLKDSLPQGGGASAGANG
jgi:preprotein translocase subunit YajC